MCLPELTMRGRRNLIRAQRGVTAIEYAVIAASISIAAVTVTSHAGADIANVFDEIGVSR
jgi:Flp pilus assembly pilin Flp